MTWAELVADLTAHLAWPAVAIVILVVFHKPIARRIEHLRSVSAGSFAAEFEPAESEVENAVALEIAQLPLGLDEPIVRHFEDIAQQADSNPTYAIVSAWALLERTLRSGLQEVWSASAVGTPFPRTGSAVLEEVARRKLVSTETVRALRTFRRLRNEVAHGAVNPGAGSAAAYVASAKELARVVERRLGHELVPRAAPAPDDGK